MQRLSSRERVLRTLNHKEPDRVPFNLSLTVDIYHRLRSHLNLPAETDKAVGVWTNVASSLDLVEAMQVDFLRVGLNPPALWTAPTGRDGKIFDEWGIGRARIDRSDGGYYYDIVEHPLAGATLKDIQGFVWPDPHDPGRVEGLRERVTQIRRETDKAIIARFADSVWEQAWWLYGLENWLVDLIEKPEITAAILDKVCEIAIGFSSVGLQAVGDLVDIVRFAGEDLGTQNGPMISQGMYERLIRPRFERLWSFTRQLARARNPDVKVMLHSCGGIRPFIPSWIEMGLEILDPIQPRAKGMEPEALKLDFGDKLVFHGGIDAQYVLPFGTTQDVYKEVQHYIHALGPGGGYIVAPAHNVQGDVPPENLVAIRDAIEMYGYYPLT